jgi:hypothetical protein
VLKSFLMCYEHGGQSRFVSKYCAKTTAEAYILSLSILHHKADVVKLIISAVLSIAF